MVFLIYIVFIIIVSVLMQLLIHELGHFIGGLLTGWHLIYLQLCHIAAIKEDKRIILKLLPFSGFQCIMYPDSAYCNAMVYTVSGCALNIVAAVISLLLMFPVFHYPALWFLFWCLFVTGIAFFIMNAIPKINQVSNDGACYLLLKSDKDILLCHNCQLMIAKLLHNGLTYKQIHKEMICITSDYADNDIFAYQAVLEYYYWLDLDNYTMARESLAKIKLTSFLSKNVLDIVFLEHLYMDLYMYIADLTKEPIDVNRYGGNILKYINTHKNGDVHSQRVKAAYDAYEGKRVGDYKEALRNLDRTIHCITDTNSIYLGETSFCISQINNIRGFVENEFTSQSEVSQITMKCKSL